MIEYDTKQFGDTVMRDFGNRQLYGKSIVASAGTALETRSKALGHPDFEELAIGESRTVSLAAVFLDLTDFTGRTFWDDPSEVVNLAHAVLTGFVEAVSAWGGYPLGLRGDGLFAGFGPGDARVDSVLALAASAFVLDAVENQLNPRLRAAGVHPVKARAGLDYGPISFVRSGIPERSEINPIGFAANFAAKCEKKAKSWEIVIGEGIAEQLPDATSFNEHNDSPKEYDRDYERKYYRFYNYHWRRTLAFIPGAVQQINGNPTTSIAIN
ncbi:adenylate/guanylate cyclase domain-containing protein [Mycolicibacterium sp. 120266]|uniref:adenylate/guanylate cyclase domain-containing protein n=1 Tax=Mycolicibacterium sp. 120266 TaxID=3090601 RepID=UPI00299E9EC5|nr:adenylate/guanylate cyclase domain-containing protein [Mycolicibacterium sp. 120266]MDX1874649.1 adenylate/guanylate cyclase domain-containing protein [Mycolicibacterium sp. 120266]